MSFLPGFQPDATTWVMRDREGELKRVRVVDMADQHLWRWIRYFRKQWREKRGFQGTDAALDELIKGEFVTAPAIYAEAYKRNVINGLAPPPTVILSKQPSSQVVEPPMVAEPGKRQITLDEE